MVPQVGLPPVDFTDAVNMGTLTGGQVSNFAASVATNVAFCVTQDASAPSIGCSTGTEWRDDGELVVNGAYATFAFSGLPGGPFNSAVAIAPPVDANPGRNTLLTTVNLSTDDTSFATNWSLQLPDNFNFTLAAGVDNAHAVTTDIGGNASDPTSLFYQLTNHIMHLTSDVATVGFAFPAITNFQHSSSYTALLGARGSLMFCPNDGQGDNHSGVASCALATTRILPPPGAAYLRVINLALDTGDSVDVCSDVGGGAGTLFVPNVTNFRGSGFSVVPVGTTTLTFFQGGTGCGSAQVFSAPLPFAPDPSSYNNLVFYGGDPVGPVPASVTTFVSTPPATPNDGSVQLSVANDWSIGGAANSIDFGISGNDIGTAVLSGDGSITPTVYAPFALPGATLIPPPLTLDMGPLFGASGYPFDPTSQWSASSYTLIAVTFPGALATDPPVLLICNDDLVVSTASSPCFVAFGNTPG